MPTRLPGLCREIFLPSCGVGNEVAETKCEEGTVVKEENVLIDLFPIKDECEVSYMSMLDDRHTSPLYRCGCCFNQVHQSVHLIHLKQQH
jgi:hypothetical protein